MLRAVILSGKELKREVQSRVMATDAPIITAPSRPLPPFGTYLRSLYDLGRRSIPTALPALVFLWFYHFGTGLYWELQGAGSSPLGYVDNKALMTHFFLKASAYLPLLVLIYTPFLPLQDSLLRGQPIGFVSAVRYVLERFVPFVLSAILQVLIIVTPVLVAFGVLLAVVAPFPALPKEVVAFLAVATVIPSLIWAFMSGLFLMFAIPAVVLDGVSPGRSIRNSARLVMAHFWGIFGRFFAFFVILFIAVVAVSFPVILFGLGATLMSHAAMPFRIAGVLWTSLVTAITFPFWVAALLVTYRSLAPAGGEASADTAGADPLGAEVPRPLSGGHPTPYLFE